LRTAFKSLGGFGNSNEGGMGGPIEAHPVIPTITAIGSSNSLLNFMRRNNRVHHRHAHLEKREVPGKSCPRETLCPLYLGF